MPTRKQTVQAGWSTSLFLTHTKKAFLLLAFLFGGFFAYRQPTAHQSRNTSFKPLKSEYRGFTIRVISKDENNYRFTITKDGKQLLHYEADEHSPQALTTPEQALAGARWMIEQNQKTGHMPHRLPPPVPMEAKRNLVSKPKQPLTDEKYTLDTALCSRTPAFAGTTTVQHNSKRWCQ